MHADTVSILFFDTTLLLGKPIFLSHMDHLGVSLLQQISKSMGFAGLVCFFLVFIVLTPIKWFWKL